MLISSKHLLVSSGAEPPEDEAARLPGTGDTAGLPGLFLDSCSLSPFSWFSESEDLELVLLGLDTAGSGELNLAASPSDRDPDFSFSKYESNLAARPSTWGRDGFLSAGEVVEPRGMARPSITTSSPRVTGVARELGA